MYRVTEKDHIISKNFLEELHMKNNKISLITGCTSGIGKALSIKFTQQGYNLILVAKIRIN